MLIVRMQSQNTNTHTHTVCYTIKVLFFVACKKRIEQGQISNCWINRIPGK